MARTRFQFACPCCDKLIEIDIRSGKARAVDVKDRKGKDLESLIADQRSESERLDDLFEEAVEDHADHHRKADELFGKAKKEAETEEPKRPPSPFDLD